MRKAYPLQSGDAKPPVSREERRDSGATATPSKIPGTFNLQSISIPSIARLTRRSMLQLSLQGSVTLPFVPALLLSGCGGGSRLSPAATVPTAISDNSAFPSVPGAPALRVAGSREIDVSWQAAGDPGGPGTASYDVQRNGAVVATVTTTSYADTELSSLTTYTYAVRAHDTSGRASSYGPATSATTMSSGAQYFGATLPELPRATVDTALAIPAASSTPRGSYYTPGFGTDAALSLQSAVDAAKFGDVVVLQAGTTYVGTIKLPLRSSGTPAYTYIISSEAPELGGSALPAAGTRVTSNAGMAAIAAPDIAGGPGCVYVGSGGVSYFRFIGIEMTSVNLATHQTQILFSCDDSTYDTLADIPHHLIVDRCFAHPFDMTGATTKLGQIHRAFGANANHFACIDSRIENIYEIGQDTQAINAITSQGPFLIRNCYLEAAGETVMFGGGTPSAAIVALGGVTPSDITIEKNHFYKRTSWIGATINGIKLDLKNVMEFKIGSRILFDQNFIQNQWAASQAFCIALTPRTNAPAGNVNPYCTVNDVTVTNNNFNQVFGVANIAAVDNFTVTKQTQRVLLRNNFVFLANLGNASGTQKVFQCLSNHWHSNSSGGSYYASVLPALDVIIDHNTFVGSPNSSSTDLLVFGNDPAPDVEYLVMSNNIFVKTNYGITASGGGGGESGLNTACGSGKWTFTKNLFLQSAIAGYPAGTLAVASPGFANSTLTTPDGFALTGTYATAGVTGAGHPMMSSGTVDNSSLGMSNPASIPTI